MKKRDLIFFSTAAAVVLADQLSKLLFREFLTKGESVAVIKNVFHLNTIQGLKFPFYQKLRSLFILLRQHCLGGLQVVTMLPP